MVKIIKFKDYPEFLPNVSPKDIFIMILVINNANSFENLFLCK